MNKLEEAQKLAQRMEANQGWAEYQNFVNQVNQSGLPIIGTYEMLAITRQIFADRKQEDLEDLVLELMDWWYTKHP